MGKVKQNVKLQTLWNIRDAKNLRALEKVFLYTVATRGTCSTSRATLQSDTGMSNGSITNVVESLTEKGLIECWQGRWEDGKRTPTLYMVKEAALASWLADNPVHHMEDHVHDVEDYVQEVEDHVHDVEDQVHDVEDQVHDVYEVVQEVYEVVHHMDEYVQEVAGKVSSKVNIEGNIKVNNEEQAAVAGAPARTTLVRETPSTDASSNEVTSKALDDSSLNEVQVAPSSNGSNKGSGFNYDEQAKVLGIEESYLKNLAAGGNKKAAFNFALKTSGA